MIKIGVLNLQGAVSEHVEMTLKAIENMGKNNEIVAEVVRYANEVAECNGIIISGGESTVIGKLIKERGIDKVIIENNIPVFGTCAGMVLLSKKTDYDQEILGIMDIEVKRNSFGRQRDSFENEINIFNYSYPGVFIRAPSVSNILNGTKDESSQIKNQVQILSVLDSNIIAVKQGNNIAMSFHPELTDDTRLHEYYLNQILELNNDN
ncbi:glutamine amidotransferase subunit [Methanobrevibacter arboriphilus JCM 13429 = DSM 1125]|uniref:Pyridoxal 5'-phosphate synthase subunit PdxT n=1 Tax=Methanobrevibacter arboriphilus JCM 13429 = DSM 1125 TaxID=1300164 RepID=A0A1V6N2D1_METAZ|nr:pyridoxal 5'-phosphate synthase glutaminase subunit PdxT [Methanobrevibacter arboriphilus]OQD58858.1 glutamine amidotransferase subunit [Methanobrevibacter arboriphilus JCM 13429 = DSM 1125]